VLQSIRSPGCAPATAYPGTPDMAVIAVINRKGGSGKSTLATNLAAYCASTGAAVLLGDVDRQQSTQTWLRLRKSQGAGKVREIVGWNVDPALFVRPPTGIDHVVLDTPGGLRGFDLARVVMYADAILMPVCNSIFDRESAADCITELRTLPRVANGRCRIGAIAMRLDARTRGAEVMEAWAASQDLPLVTVLRESQAYVRCIERGIALFDLPAVQVETDLAQWQAILQWLRPVFEPAAAEDSPRHTAVQPTPTTRAASVLKAVPRPAAPAPTAVRPTTRAPVLACAAGTRPAASPVGRWLDALPIPRFLQRTP
jgi:chromosome partitioning protein